MKKAISIFCIIAMIFSFVSITTYASPELVIEDGVLTRYNGSSDTVVIPSNYLGNRIDCIGETAFKGNAQIKKVTLESGVDVISSEAFSGCSNLKEVYCPDTLLIIGLNAFKDCYNLEILDYPKTAEYMRETPKRKGARLYSDEAITENGYEFLNGTIISYSGEETELVIPETIGGQTVTAIGEKAFYENANITSVVMPNTITYIGKSAFQYCSALANVEFSDTLENVGSFAFSNTGLLHVTIPGSLKKMGIDMFNGCKSLVSAIIEEGVEDLNDRTFYECFEFTTVTLPSTLIKVNTYSFGYCKKLNNVTLPNGLKSIGSASFMGCHALASIVMPDSITSIGTHAFRNCPGLKNVKISEQITTLPLRCFCGCEFPKIILPKSIRNIDKEAFYQARSLVEITLHENISYIGNAAFNGCYTLKKAVVLNPNVSVSTDAFINCSLVKLYCFEASTAEAYAIANNIPYAILKTYILETNGGTAMDNVITDIIETEPVPENGDLVFLGWYDNIDFEGDRIEFPYSGEATTLYAKWPGLKKFTFITNGGTAVAPFSALQINEEPITAITFLGWYDNPKFSGERLTFPYAGDNSTFYAKWSGFKNYSFETNGGTEVADIYNFTISNSPVTEKGNLDFLGWYDNEELLGDAIAFPYSGEAETLYAKWGSEPYTETTVKDYRSFKFFDVKLHNDSSGQIILALYKDSNLVDLQSIEYIPSDTAFYVPSALEYDSAKVMFWKDYSGAEPITEAIIPTEIPTENVITE